MNILKKVSILTVFIFLHACTDSVDYKSHKDQLLGTSIIFYMCTGVLEYRNNEYSSYSNVFFAKVGENLQASIDVMNGKVPDLDIIKEKGQRLTYAMKHDLEIADAKGISQSLFLEDSLDKMNNMFTIPEEIQIKDCELLPEKARLFFKKINFPLSVVDLSGNDSWKKLNQS